MGRRASGQLLRKSQGKTIPARDDGVTAFHYLRSRAGGVVRFVSLGACDFREARRRADMVLAISAGSVSESDWLRSLVALGELARSKLGDKASDQPARVVSFESAWKLWLDRADMSREPRTLQSVEGRWIRFRRWAGERGFADLGAVTAETAREYAAVVGSAKRSAKRDLQTLRALWRDLALCPVWDGIKPPRLAHVAEDNTIGRRYRRLETAEVRRIVRTAQGEYRSAVVAGYCTALRLSDVAGLRWEDFREGGRRLEVLPGKTAGSKGIPLSIPVAEDLREALGEFRTDGLVFPDLAARKPEALSKVTKALFVAAGVQDDRRGKASFHSLRATFISLMDEAGIPPHVTDAITGHAKQGMHGRYSQPSLEAKRAAVEKALPRIFPLD